MRELTEDNLNDIMIWGRFNLPPEKMAVMLEFNMQETDLFCEIFKQKDSPIRMAWEKGRINEEVDVMQGLENHASSGEDGAGDAAIALSKIRNRQKINQLKEDLFGL